MLVHRRTDQLWSKVAGAVVAVVAGAVGEVVEVEEKQSCC